MKIARHISAHRVVAPIRIKPSTLRPLDKPKVKISPRPGAKK